MQHPRNSLIPYLWWHVGEEIGIERREEELVCAGGPGVSVSIRSEDERVIFARFHPH